MNLTYLDHNSKLPRRRLIAGVLTIVVAFCLAPPASAQDYKGFSAGECTNYAARYFDITAPYPKHNWRGNAGMWLTNAQAQGWHTSYTLCAPLVNGTLIVWRNGGAGHVGVVHWSNAYGIYFGERNWPIGAGVTLKFLTYSQIARRGSYTLHGYIYQRRR